MRALLALLAGCALTSKGKPLDVQYFTPPQPTTAPAAQPARAQLRLARVTASSHLDHRIAVRHSAIQLSLYEARRWTETPEVYVRRSLERALFEVRGIREITGGASLALDVDVLAFEEVTGASPRGRVQLHYQLRDDRKVVATGLVTVERPASVVRFDAVVDAIATALDEATARVADEVLPKLEAAP